ncbi:hypothetical protein ACQPZ2_06500 [Nocardia pseudovaccinii]|uniref:hypothetical protein n=1 Tax=Nocardia pseudovaccinii TaxID=189540 RepID=UPI003D8A3E7B
MNRRTRLFVLPGGVLEVADYGDENDGPGVYPELRTPADHLLPQRIPGAGVADHRISPVEPADAETCATVLRLLRDLP